MGESLVPRGRDDTLASSEPSPEKNHQPERLKFEKLSGTLRYGRIPYEIHYDLNAPTMSDSPDDTLLHETFPGNYLLEPEEGGPNAIVNMWVHESVPPQYKDIIAYHELFEAELELGNNMDRVDAHNLAVDATNAYAKAHLSPEEFKEYKDWERNVLPNIVARRSKGHPSSE